MFESDKDHGEEEWVGPTGEVHTLADLFCAVASEMGLYISYEEEDEGDSHHGYVSLTYSGRGMYGARTPAVVCSSSRAVELGVAFGHIAEEWEMPHDQLMRWIPRRQDSMGHDVVFY